MKSKKLIHPISVIMSIYFIILMMYMVTYSYHSPLIWAFFLIERLMSYSYEQSIEEYIEKAFNEEKFDYVLVSIIVQAIITVIIYGYTLFKCRTVFFIMVFGEILDLVIKAIRYQVR